MARDIITDILDARRITLDEYVKNPSNRRSVGFFPVIAEAMVMGRQLLERAHNPENVKAVVTNYRQGISFSIIEQMAGPVDEVSDLRQLLEASSSFMVDPSDRALEPAIARLGNLGIDPLQHWAIRNSKVTHGNEEYLILEPFFMAQKKEIRDGWVAWDSFKLMMEGAGKLGFDGVVVQTHAPLLRWLRREGFVMLADTNRDLARSIQSERGNLSFPTTAVKPLTPRFQGQFVAGE